MYFDPECIPCIIRQAHRAAKLFTNGNTDLQLKILREACERIEILNKNFTAPHFSAVIQEIVERNVKMDNPYKEVKAQNITQVKKIIPGLDERIAEAENKLDEAIKIAILGNIIDIGANPDIEIEDEVQLLDTLSISQNVIEEFKETINSAETILYIGDNYEEALFDKFLLRELSDKDLTFATRSKPILNDITYDDAVELGIDKICKVIESGSKIGGCDLNQCSSEFTELFNNSDVVISKGQGNYETLLQEKRPIYFLFRVKCEPIAIKSGLKVGNGALLYQNLSVNK